MIEPLVAGARRHAGFGGEPDVLYLCDLPLGGE